MDNNIFFKGEILNEEMAISKFYFYNIFLNNKEGKAFNWDEELNKIYQETQVRNPNYQNHISYTLSVHIVKKEDLEEGKFYFGYLVVSEDEESYRKEKKGDFFELGLEEDEHLLHTAKGKLYFLIWLNNEGKIILMLERQYFAINIKGFLNYFKERYPDIIDEIQSKNIIGRELKLMMSNLKDNKIKLVRLYFKKYTPKERIRQFGFVEKAIPNLLEKGIYADITLRWNKPLTTETFFTKFFKTQTFEEALDVDFGEFLKIFNFDTDNDTIPSLNLMDKIICFILPRDKSEYSDEQMFLSMKEGFENKKDKLI